MVHITNGDSVAGELRRWAGEPRLIVWRDALHEGPIAPGLPLEALTELRLAWFRQQGYPDLSPLMRERDRLLRRLVSRDNVWLWFEDDLYDQLQLIQCLAFLQAEGLTAGPHFLVPIPRTLHLEDMAGLAAAKTRLTPAMFTLGAAAWDAFTHHRVAEFLTSDLAALPDLRPAFERLLDTDRIERTILALLATGPLTAPQLFAAYQRTEERPFLGDEIFYHHLFALAPRVNQDAHGLWHLAGA